jgi:hypothetical protein
MFMLKAHVVTICFKCFRGMLQVFCIGVAKVYWDITKIDRDVAHAAMAMHVCFKCMS